MTSSGCSRSALPITFGTTTCPSIWWMPRKSRNTQSAEIGCTKSCAGRLRALRAPDLGPLGVPALPRHPPDRRARRRAEGDGERAAAAPAARHLRAARGRRALRAPGRPGRASPARRRARRLGVLRGENRARAVEGGGGAGRGRGGGADEAARARGAGRGARSPYSGAVSAFPATRLRRLRRTGPLRSLVRETRLVLDDFVYPLFVGPDTRPNVELPPLGRFSVDDLPREAEEVLGLGISAVILFGIPEEKDDE